MWDKLFRSVWSSEIQTRKVSKLGNRDGILVLVVVLVLVLTRVPISRYSGVLSRNFLLEQDLKMLLEQEIQEMDNKM